MVMEVLIFTVEMGIYPSVKMSTPVYMYCRNWYHLHIIIYLLYSNVGQGLRLGIGLQLGLGIRPSIYIHGAEAVVFVQHIHHSIVPHNIKL